MNAAKVVFLLVLLVAALLAGAYLSGLFVGLLIGVDVPLGPKVWWSYWQAMDTARMQPYVTKVKVAGALGFGSTMVVWLGFLVLAFKRQQKSAHGEARFASRGEVARHGLLDDKPGTGIVVGRLGGKLVTLPGQQFAILAAPTRSGKGVGVVIPNLLEYRDSIVVLDIKQENFQLTSGWRREIGQSVYLFNPFAEDGRTHRWNPLSYVSRDPAFRVSDLLAIAAMLYPDVGEEQKFWVSQARNAFLAFTLYLFDFHDHEIASGLPAAKATFPTFGHVYRVSTGDGRDLKAQFKEMLERPFVSLACRNAFAGLVSQAEETFASIIGTFKEPLNPWINPVLDAATSSNDFWLTDLRRKPMTIYIGITPNKLAEARLIVNLFFSQLINVNTRELPQDNPALNHQCLLLMDEFTSIGKVDIIANAVSYMAGYNLRLLPVIQSMAQLDATYGHETSRTLITNHAMQVIFAPREQRDANDYSEMLGYTTLRKRNLSRSRGANGSVTLTDVEERRALMLPQELKAMGREKEVILCEGLANPIMAQKIRYYEDPHFTERLLPAVDVEPLAFMQRISRTF
ncbi:type IV secretory system conjugative DNA transfer family protein [Thermomonas fusca]|uniref:Type IV secretory system conjugative DNA transfer family protein n=1 Tax=Thermomonas fusca TaxID=215690 RepID=A0A5R9PCN8_9GAMM|nr:type IV secretory system conjugative DNA transfer family protein [Thermomonas fusca]TLX20867.1 type IV secretory system conjugative DNA transfer family protein [Thermomonas fusca]